MPTYQYTAKNLESRIVKDSIEAADLQQLETRLKQQKLFLLKAKQVKTKEEGNYRFKPEELADFNRQLAAMMASGITLVRAVNIILQRDMKPAMQKVYRRVYRQLQQGVVLSDALEKQEGCFPELMINMYRAGEASGSMEKVAAKLANHYTKEQKTSNKLRSAMTYPVILLCLAGVIMIVVFTFVLPSFFDMFDSVGAEMPGITLAVMAVSHFLTDNFLFVITGLLIFIALVIVVLRLPKVRLAVDKLKLRLPKVSGLMKIIYTARFARTLSSMYSSGLSMLRALEVTAGTIGNTYIAAQFSDVASRVRGGATLSGAVQPVEGFDKKLISTIYIGEEAGRLDEMLDSIADSFDYESEQAIDKLIAMIEPLMIVVMGFMIGIVVISVLLPLFTMYQSM